MSKKTVSILICAYNEEKNIGAILNQVICQKIPPDYDLEKVVVVSDSSTDETNQIVTNFPSSLVELRVNEKRMGKALSFNIGKAGIQSDYLISLDADVKLEKDAIFHLLPSYEAVCDLAACHGMPSSQKNSTLASIASRGTYYLLNEIAAAHPNTIFQVRGVMLLLSKLLYRDIELPNAPGTDQFMYWSCRRMGGVFMHRPKAIVYYSVPSTVRDYMKQNHRFSQSLQVQESVFGKDFVHQYDLHWKQKVSIFLKTLCSHPFSIACWLIVFSYSRLRSIGKSKTISGIWEMVHSTK